MCWPTGTQEPAPAPSTCQRAIYADSSTQAVSHTFPADVSAAAAGLVPFRIHYTTCVCVFFFFFVSRGLSVDKTWPFQSAPRLFLRVSIEISHRGSGTFHLAQSAHFRQLIIIFHSCFKVSLFLSKHKKNKQTFELSAKINHFKT